ncbi:hypothetical protein P1X14_07055 [Sphingomonas sp. AOB5]|uniref:hypothetical protein n=1 Tax=Sphingomonas sp. AOB5 TaxID=3034017 RepID=UPI0023F93F9B|nr:hypothetical protein [Sphingomonas sp. AOB5]MDF7774997.1 hypothetical protein [Sphingomonas sp. AOB5]
MAGPARVQITAPRNPDQRAVTAYFMAQGAVLPGDAVLYSPAKPAEREQFELMVRSGVIKQAGQGGYYWLDIAAYNADSRSRQAKLGAAAALIAVILAVALMFLYQGGSLTPP